MKRSLMFLIALSMCASILLVASPAWAVCSLSLYTPTYSVQGVTARSVHQGCAGTATLTTELWHQKVGPDSRLAQQSGTGGNLDITATAACLITPGSDLAAYYSRGISSQAGSGDSGLLWQDC